MPPAGAGEAVFAAQARTVLAAVGGRLEEGARLRGLSDAADAPRRLDERMRAVFGPAFLALPRFSCPPEQASELGAALDGSTDLQGGDPLAVSTWLVRAQRVRAPVDRFAGVLGTAEVLGTGERLELAVAQLPASASELWVGLPLQNGERPPRGTVSVVVHRPEPVDVAGPLAAVFVDEWVETVPDPEETTAITFQCDPPSTAPPQSLLLAVPPIPGQPWTVGILQRVLAEAFDLAKLRAVPPNALSVVGQYLPAVFLALNADQDAVSTDPGPLTQKGRASHAVDHELDAASSLDPASDDMQHQLRRAGARPALDARRPVADRASSRARTLARRSGPGTCGLRRPCARIHLGEQPTTRRRRQLALRSGQRRRWRSSIRAGGSARRARVTLGCCG